MCHPHSNGHHGSALDVDTTSFANCCATAAPARGLTVVVDGHPNGVERHDPHAPTSSATVTTSTSHAPSHAPGLPGLSGQTELSPAIDTARIERAVAEILLAIGEDPTRDGLIDTPKRVAKAYAQIFAGLHQDPATHLARVFEEYTDDLVMCRGIEFYTMCEHHLLPFFGRCHIAYKPDGRQVVGLSKLARTVEVFARRPQVQERLTNQIADAIMEHVAPQGVIVVIEAEHLCMKMRGVNKQQADMLTTAHRGCFAHPTQERAEAIALLTAKR